VISSPTPSSTTTTGPRRSQRGDDHARSLSALSPSSVCAHELAGARHRRGQPPPPRALASVPLPRGRPAQRTRRAPRVSPMPSAWLPTPYSAAAASSPARPWRRRRGRPPRPAPGPRWTGGPAPATPVHSPAVDPPLPIRHVASRVGHTAPPWPFCKKVPQVLRNKPAVPLNSKVIRFKSCFKQTSPWIRWYS
jgi:hypothetical protein